MSLGVLNNLSAMRAETSLNNTTNNLSNTLQQLSSGSKINSGADDAAGMSMVNGLAANSSALAQSQTNAAEGVGLLQVADGALSQVTNLLNRAVTLATEASNGTLSSTQDAAANQEYKSILSEINNIGSTTTYNGIQVFGSDKQIYTGDSTATGASVNNLNITSLNTTSGVGNTGGTMSYSTGTSAFIDLGAGANAGDSLGTAAGVGSLGTTKLDVTYANPSGGSNLTATITVGTGTAYSDNVGGLINAINNSGLNLTASFGTAAQAGSSDTSTNTGIIISGSVGTAAVSATQTVKLSDDATAGNQIVDTQVGSAQSALTGGTVGTAAISYTQSGGATLTGDLTNQGSAQTTLTALNAAISAVSAQDGYVGAQINTLNAASQVLTTQQENVVSAQNAVQATDYATATSQMSKYQILSQTGISALAQANSMSQEVAKLLQ
jgi:flagellin